MLLQTLDAYILLESPYPVGKKVVAVRQQAQMVAKTGPKSWRPVPLSEVDIPDRMFYAFAKLNLLNMHAKRICTLG